MAMQHHLQPLLGLTTDEVAQRREQGLGSIPPPATSRSYAQILRENVLTTINIILFSIAFALVLVGQYLDALVSVGVISFNLVISLIQEVRAKRTLDRIALLTRPRATILRDGREQQVDPGDIVVDDVLIVSPGDQIVVDGPIIGEGRVEVDESLLTGESDPVTKQEGDRLYSGTFCIAGQACYRAEHVGVQSVAGALTVGARAYHATYTPLERDINLIVRTLLLVAIFLEVLLIAASIVSVIPIVETVRMAMVIIGIVPNGLFLSISVAYALGAVRMAGKGALVQKFNAIESLSHVDVLCTDKTGTLTANMLAVEVLHPYGMEEAALRRVLGSYIVTTSSSNPTSAAIRAACAQQAQPWLHIREEIPFSSARKWSALVVADEALPGVYVLGAPEMLQPFLHADAHLGTFLEEQVARGMRVLLFAYSPDPVQLQTPAGEAHLPHGLIPLGAVSLRDALRPEARETLVRLHEVGVQIKVISGDHPQTVAALAKQVGLAPESKSISGVELETLDAAQLAEVAQEVTIFGRITPPQKERLVQALRSRGHYVAMIGDGVNDVLALKQANLGIAMQSGSQATRGVADLVLLQDTFAPLPAAFREGQRIRNGMRDILQLFLTRVLSVTLLLIAIAFIGGFPFQPRQTSILTFLTVGVPALALAYWARPGHRSRQGLFRSLARFVLPASVMFCLVAIGVYLVVLLPAVATLPPPANPYREGALPLAQTALTVFAVVCGLALVLFVQPPARLDQHGQRRNWRPTLLVLGLFVCLVGVLAIAPLRAFFNLQALDAFDYLIIGGATVLWAALVQTIWHVHLFERFLQPEWKREAESTSE
jgi:cation-transporting P-type ATPase E